MYRILLILISFTSLSSLNSFAQDSTNAVLFFGLVKAELQDDKIDGASIAAISKGDTIAIIHSDAEGKYSMYLPYGRFYQVHYTREGYARKILNVDTRDIPIHARDGGFGLDIDISLPIIIPGFDYNMLEQAIGLAQYEVDEDNFSFDNPYTRKKIVEYMVFKGKLEKAMEE